MERGDPSDLLLDKKIKFLYAELNDKFPYREKIEEYYFGSIIPEQMEIIRETFEKFKLFL